MKIYVIVYIWKDVEEHYEFVDVFLQEVEAYKRCNLLNQKNELGYYDVVVKEVV